MCLGSKSCLCARLAALLSLEGCFAACVLGMLLLAISIMLRSMYHVVPLAWLNWLLQTYPPLYFGFGLCQRRAQEYSGCKD